MDKRLDFTQMAASLAVSEEGADYPLDQWAPQDCGPLPLQIDGSGVWWSTDTPTPSPYRRPELVKLLSKLLWCEPECFSPAMAEQAPSYSLRTPQESVSISVVDVPFCIVSYQWVSSKDGPTLTCTTNVGDQCPIDSDHPLVTGYTAPFLPYVLVRRNLWAKFSRSAYYALVDECILEKDKNPKEHRDSIGITSAGRYYPIGKL